MTSTSSGQSVGVPGSATTRLHLRSPGAVARHHRRGRPAVRAGLAATVTALAAAGVLATVWHERPRVGAAWFDPPGTAARAATAAVAPDSTGDPAPPTRIRIPAIGVDATLEALHLDPAGALAAPVRFGEAGWYADGTPPGAMGPAVVAGHVDSTRGPAVFFRLGDLHPGDLIEVARSGGWLAFRVTRVDRYPKAAFPTAAVYGPTPDAELRLITCGGAFNRRKRSYLDNVVVYAVAV